ncbi:serine/threonine protein kinase [Streptomyces sp. NBC_01142]|uniref:serine/threonine-protein kinase n=1 Tax=Streptomyces sp. NBC_01142 TaxID=2975865 RepID=UPI00225BFEC2|nr:serine/threonine-protein kinase [Streptomyces sp. NBC_01142]MCX4818604.1 serine/threonine protein kinase [Streptomyces sp. NBC_01142]
MQPLDPGEPQTIGAYRLLGRLGAGGMGRVYLGRSAGGRTVAVKVVHPHFALDEEFRARFRREVQAARRVGGEWTAPVLDADPEAPVPWVATGYVAGPSLSRAVAEHGPLPTSAVRVLGAGLAEALAAVHGLELVHRDVKPSNVLLTLDGPRLIDFGIARAWGSPRTEFGGGTASLTSTGVSVGSPGYMSPEQILGRSITGAADVFSLGAVLAYAATGEAPFPGDSSAALLYKVVHEEPELGSLEGDLRELVAACLAKSPDARPAPGEIAGRLAPGGAVSLIGTGWLPGPLVEQVSRSAVSLLDLEPAHADPAASGPVAFSSPAIGTFGPPVEPALHGPRTPAPEPAPSGGFSFSADTGGNARRGRRVSCTVALTVAGALAAVTVGGGVLLDLWPRDADSRKSGDAAEPPAATASTSAEPVTSVPKGFIGTWQGRITQDSGLAGGRFTAVISEGERGDDVVRTSTVLGPLTCNGVGRLVSATGARLRIEERTDPDRPSTADLCTSGTASVTYTRTADGTLRFQSAEEAAGNPYATLKKAGN